MGVAYPLQAWALLVVALTGGMRLGCFPASPLSWGAWAQWLGRDLGCSLRQAHRLSSCVQRVPPGVQQQMAGGRLNVQDGDSELLCVCQALGLHGGELGGLLRY